MAPTLGRYEPLKQLADGSLGAVYLARPLDGATPDARVVLKMLNPYLFAGRDIDAVWLQDTCQLNAELEDPRIVRFESFGRSRSEYFLVMPFVDGDTVEHARERSQHTGKRVPMPVAVRIAEECAAALGHGHSRPLCVVHANVTPRNVLLRFADGAVRLMDYGVAELKNRYNRASIGPIPGRYAFFAPEQFEEGAPDPRVDVFALGMVLHELLTGERLFQHANEFDTMKAIRQCQVPKPSLANPAVPPELDALVLRATARRPDDRYPHGDALTEALRALPASVRGAGPDAALREFVQTTYADYLARRRASVAG